MKQTPKLSLLTLACLVLALSVLNACSTNSDNYGTVPVVVKEPDTVKMIDAFTKFVMAILVSAPDNQESVAVNDVMPTSPDNTEPELVN